MRRLVELRERPSSSRISCSRGHKSPVSLSRLAQLPGPDDAIISDRQHFCGSPMQRCAKRKQGFECNEFPEPPAAKPTTSTNSRTDGGLPRSPAAPAKRSGKAAELLPELRKVTVSSRGLTFYASPQRGRELPPSHPARPTLSTYPYTPTASAHTRRAGCSGRPSRPSHGGTAFTRGT